MGWRLVVVNEHSKLSYKNNHLIFKSSTSNEMFHLSEVDILLLETTDIAITTMLIKRLVDENILVIFCDNKRLPKAKLMPFYGRHDSSLQMSRQLEWQADKKGVVWTEIIAQKIFNQGQHLSDQLFDEKSQRLQELKEELTIFDMSNREGHAARIYFNTLFGNDFSREVDSDINAGLDYGYSLILSIFAREIVKNGCLTQLGLKHSNQFNDFNLASDIMEPFRIIVDQIVYEHQHKNFLIIKRELFSMFGNTYSYNGKGMYLTNIAEDYTKRVIKFLNNETDTLPVFRI